MPWYPGTPDSVRPVSEDVVVCGARLGLEGRASTGLAWRANASWLVPLLICLDSPQVTNESHDDGSFLHILCRPVVQSLVEAVWAGLA